MSVSDIDEVVLVGGTTRIPRVKQQLRYGTVHALMIYYTSQGIVSKGTQ